MHDPSMLREAITDYFPAEKRESLLFIIVGITAIVVAVLLIADESPYVGMAYPLVAVGLIQLAVGATVYFRTDRQISQLLVGVEADPAGTAQRELVRMIGVNRGFIVYRWTEVVLMAAGIVGLVLLRESRLLFSVATGLVVQTGLMLLLDIVAERRASLYLKRIENYEGRMQTSSSPGMP
jgi:hypothetical protein